MHSTWTIFSGLQRIARPANSSGTSVVDTTWFGTTSAIRSNHQAESWLSSLPLSGIGVGSETS